MKLWWTCTTWLLSSDNCSQSRSRKATPVTYSLLTKILSQSLGKEEDFRLSLLLSSLVWQTECAKEICWENLLNEFTWWQTSGMWLMEKGYPNRRRLCVLLKSLFDYILYSSPFLQNTRLVPRRANQARSTAQHRFPDLFPHQATPPEADRFSSGSFCSSSCQTQTTATASHGKETTASSSWSIPMKLRGDGENARTSQTWTTINSAGRFDTTTTRTSWRKSTANATPTSSTSKVWPNWTNPSHPTHNFTLHRPLPTEQSSPSTVPTQVHHMSTLDPLSQDLHSATSACHRIHTVPRGDVAHLHTPPGHTGVRLAHLCPIFNGLKSRSRSR